MQEANRWIPLYTSSRRVAAFMSYPYVFNTKGQWIGFVTPEGEVYNIHGHHVGFLDPDPRLARILSRGEADKRADVAPPPPPDFSPQPSWTVPLPPKPPPLPQDTIDILESAPERLPPYEG